MKNLALACGLMLALTSSAALAQDYDQIQTTTNLMPGVIVETTPVTVTVQQTAGNKILQVNEIEWIRYQGEPKELSQGRQDAERGAYEDALNSLSKVNVADISREEVKQDLAYYKLYSQGRLALGGKGDTKAAATALYGWINANKGSYHYLEANELLGDLLTASGIYDQAARYYSEVAKAPWPDYKMRALLAVGRSQLAQGNAAEALKQFDQVASMEGTGKGAESAKLLAQVGKADALAAGGKADEAVKLAEQVIARAPADADEVYSRAYNALGNAYRKQNQPKQALLAYLHVPILFSAYPEAHAEALANLSTLWMEVNQAERARQAKAMLEERYPNSRWVQK